MCDTCCVNKLKKRQEGSREKEYEHLLIVFPVNNNLHYSPKSAA